MYLSSSGNPYSSTHITWPVNMARGLSCSLQSKTSVSGMFSSAEGQCLGHPSSVWYQYNRSIQRRHWGENMHVPFWPRGGYV